MKLNPGQITLAEFEKIYRNGKAVRLVRSCRRQVEAASRVVIRAAASDQAVYGINTGFGKLAHTRIAPQQATRLQRNLILSHCCGVGEPLPANIVRLVMVLKLLSLGRGASGVRWRIIEQIEDMLRHDITPLLPAQGSVGASGDLAPLAHMAAAMIGEGKVIYQGKLMSAARALNKSGLAPVTLGPKEGLGLINGTQVSTALALAGLFDAWRLTQSALVTGALSSDAMMASTAPFRQEIQDLRGHRGQIDAAAALRQILSGSQIRESHRFDDDRVQDPYCLRCQPQVMGACMDLLRHAGVTLKIEANAVTDNPLVISADGAILSGGNFHAEPVAFAADQCALAITEIGSITERRIATLVDPALNHGLPAFLSPDPGLNSGFMIAEVTAAALMAENKQRATPCSIDSTPTSANQEDHVSMACHGARRLLQMNHNLAYIIGIELLTAAQGVKFRAPVKTSRPLLRVIRQLRKEVSQLGQDRFLATDLARAGDQVEQHLLIKAVGESSLPVL